MENYLDDPDFAILVVGAARVVADRLGASVQRAGVEDMRAPFGFVILGHRAPRYPWRLAVACARGSILA